MEKETEHNILISPISLYFAIFQIYPAAEHKTKEEISALLDIEEIDTEESNKANSALLDIFKSKNNDHIELAVANNSLWIDNQFQLENDYQSMIEQFYQGKVETIDGSSETDVNKLNEWVSEKTRGIIEDISEAPLGDNFVAMIANAVYFNGDWTYPFNPEVTEKGTFHSTDEGETDVPFMTLQKKLNYVKNDQYEAVKLPYGDKGDLGMYLFLPEDDGHLESIYEALQRNSVTKVMRDFQSTEGSGTLPKFEWKMNTKWIKY